MKLNYATLSIAAATLAAALAGFTPVAEAGVVVWLDNSPDPSGYPTQTQSTNSVCVRLKLISTGTWTTEVCHIPDSVTEVGHSYCFSDVSSSNVQGLRIRTTGTNLFWVDQWELRTSNICSYGALVTSRGIDSQVGYCFSKTPADGADDACDASGTADGYPTPGTATSYEYLVWVW